MKKLFTTILVALSLVLIIGCNNDGNNESYSPTRTYTPPKTTDKPDYRLNDEKREDILYERLSDYLNGDLIGVELTAQVSTPKYDIFAGQPDDGRSITSIVSYNTETGNIQGSCEFKLSTVNDMDYAKIGENVFLIIGGITAKITVIDDYKGKEGSHAPAGRLPYIAYIQDDSGIFFPEEGMEGYNIFRVFDSDKGDIIDVHPAYDVNMDMSIHELDYNTRTGNIDHSVIADGKVYEGFTVSFEKLQRLGPEQPFAE